jgi:glycosyltransferase involved in cell wall biosynthesis
MKFSVITPTLQRQSLIECCRSVDIQDGAEIQHIVMVDCEHLREDLLEKIARPNRLIVKCERPHQNGGNSCRHNAWKLATGEYIFYLDDDNTLADFRVFADIAFALHQANMPAWALFPINRLGGRFYCDPPRSCHVDTMNVVLRWDYAEWPDTTAYGSDGVLVDSLIERGVAYAAFPDFREIGIISQLNFCK